MTMNDIINFEEYLKNGYRPIKHETGITFGLVKSAFCLTLKKNDEEKIFHFDDSARTQVVVILNNYKCDIMALVVR